MFTRRSRSRSARFSRVHADRRAPLSRRGYLDVTEISRGRVGDADCRGDQGEDRAETGLTAPQASPTTNSSPNSPRIIASPMVSSSSPKDGAAFVENLPVERFHGVGPATTAKMNRLGIRTGIDLREQTLAFLQQHFGKPDRIITGSRAHRRTVCPSRPDPQVSCAENTFPTISLHSKPHARRSCRSSKRSGAFARSRDPRAHVTLKVKYADFQQITRSRTGQSLFSTRAEIEQLSYALLEPLFPVTKGIDFSASPCRRSVRSS